MKKRGSGSLKAATHVEAIGAEDITPAGLSSAEVSPPGAVSSAPVKVIPWAAQENYVCQLCPYATLDLGAILTHLRAMHGVSGFDIEALIEPASETAVDIDSEQGDGLK